MRKQPSPRQLIFSERLQDYVGSEPVGTAARRLGIEYRRFYRWYWDGIARPNHHSLDDVKRLASAMGLNDWRQLWEPDLVKAEYRAMLKKVEVLYADAKTYRGLLVKGIDMLWGRWQEDQRHQTLK